MVRHPISANPRSVFVTGASGGLGTEVSERLAAAGWIVFAADTDAAGLARISGRHGVIPLLVDVTRGEELARARRSVEEVTDGLDGLVCCAGIFTGGPLAEAPETLMLRAIDVNLMGVFRSVRELFPLLARRNGTIVAVGSEATRCAMPFNGPYTVSKCALESYCDVLRRELMFAGVSVSTVQPGAIRTPLLEAAERAFREQSSGSRFGTYLDVARALLSRDRETGMDPGRAAAIVVRAVSSRKPQRTTGRGTTSHGSSSGSCPPRGPTG